jgi:hypothetical protein
MDSVLFSSMSFFVIVLCSSVKPERVRHVTIGVDLATNNTFVLNVEFGSPKDDQQLLYLLSLSCNGGTFINVSLNYLSDVYWPPENVFLAISCLIPLYINPHHCCVGLFHGVKLFFHVTQFQKFYFVSAVKDCVDDPVMKENFFGVHDVVIIGLRIIMISVL